MRVKTVLTGLLFLLVLWVLLPYGFMRLNGYLGWPVFDWAQLKIVGLILMIAAVATDVYLLALFKMFGKGTPVPIEPTKKLIVTGPYNKTRNPMYLGHLAIYLGLFLYFGHLTLAALFLIAAVGLNLLVIKWEEPDLKRRLGKDYGEYTRTVPRWF